MTPSDKPLVWLYGKIQTPPFSKDTRLKAGFLLRKLQLGERIEMPHSRPMPSIGARVHELRINDRDNTWRIIYRIDEDAIIIGEVFSKKTKQTPKRAIDACQRRFSHYDEVTGG